jgi:hypothetical protein
VIARIYHGLAVAALSLVLAQGGVAGFLAATGRLNGQRVSELVALMRGDAPSQPPAPVREPAVAPDPQPSAPVARRPTAEEVRQQRLAEHLARDLAERAGRDLAAQRELLMHAAQDLTLETERLDQARSEWLAQQGKLQQKARDDGFENELKLVAKLAPRQAKDHLVMTWKSHPADAVRLLQGLNPGRAQRILEQFKSPEEAQIMHELIVQLRERDIGRMADSRPGKERQ